MLSEHVTDPKFFCFPPFFSSLQLPEVNHLGRGELNPHTEHPAATILMDNMHEIQNHPL